MLNPGDEPIPGYRLLKFLGKGTFGEVWQASSPGGAQIALKFLDLADKQGWKEFRAIERIKKVRHANLLHIHALWLLDSRGEVLEFNTAETLSNTSVTQTLAPTPTETAKIPRQLVVATGLADGTLRDRLAACQREGATGIPADELLKYMEDAARGLDFLNAQRHEFDGKLVALQHCDVKPANLMLMGDSCILGDFGLVSILSKQGVAATATGMVGSLAYMSPECIRKKPGATSDQYSLALTYYELRTGRLPFEAEDPLSVAEAHLRGKLTLAGVTPNEERVLRRATAAKPESRFATNLEMVEALQAAVTPAPSAKGSWWRLIAAAALLMSVIAGVAWYRGLGSGKPVVDGPPKGGDTPTVPPVIDSGQLLQDFRTALQAGDTSRAKEAYGKMGDETQQKARVVMAAKLPQAWQKVRGLAFSPAGTELITLGTLQADRTALTVWPLSDSGTLPSTAPAPIELPMLVQTMAGGSNVQTMACGAKKCVVVGERSRGEGGGKVTVVAVVDLQTRSVKELELSQSVIDPDVILDAKEELVVLTGAQALQSAQLWGWRMAGAEPTALAPVELSELRFAKSLEFCGDGQSVVVGGDSKAKAGAVYMLSVGSWTAEQRPEGADRVWFSADQSVNQLAAAGAKHVLVASGAHVARGDADRLELIDVNTGQLRAELSPVPGAIVRLASQATPSGLWLACGGNSAAAAWYWAGESAEPKLVLRGNARYDSNVGHLAFPASQDGWLLVAGRPAVDGSTTRTANSQAVLDLWPLQQQPSPAAVTLELPQIPVALSAAGRWAAVAMADSVQGATGKPAEIVELLDLRHLQLLHELGSTPILISPTANPVAVR
ncbi:MAG: serine/threonine-protein kinase [Pirellulales bacterium]